MRDDKKKELITKSAEEFSKLNEARERIVNSRRQHKEVSWMKVQGTFNTQRFFETLARIISQRENVTVTVRVTPLEKEEEQHPALENVG